MYEVLHSRGLRVRQIDLTIQLFAKFAPVEFYEGMFFADFPHNLIGNTRPFAKLCQVQLLHFSIAAHVVHQIVGVSSAANESHRIPCTARRVTESAAPCPAWQVPAV